MNNDASLQNGEGAEFGEYNATKSSKDNFILDGTQNGNNSYGRYDTETKEIVTDSQYNPPMDILQATSEGITLGIGEGFDNPSYDVLQATSESEGKGTHGATYKVKGDNSSFTQFVDDNLPTGEIFNTDNFQTNEQIAEYQTTDTNNATSTQFDYLKELNLTDEGGAQFGEYQSTKTKDGLKAEDVEKTGFDFNEYNFSDSAIDKTSALNFDNLTGPSPSNDANAGYDFGGYQKNEQNIDANLYEILHQSIEPEVDTQNINENTNNQLKDININTGNNSNLYNNEYQTYDKTTTNLNNYDSPEKPSTSPLLDIIPTFDNDENNEFNTKEQDEDKKTNEFVHEAERYDAAELKTNDKNKIGRAHV